MPIQPNPLVKYGYDPQDIVPQPSTTLGPDEDLWTNPVLPVAASNFRFLPYLPDPEEIPAASLITPFGFGSGDGSWSSASYLALPNGIRLSYQFDPQDPGGALAVLFQPDEDFWVNPVAPVIPEPTILWLADDWAINPNFDEDFWASGVAPALQGLNWVPSQWSFETDEFVPPPVFAQVADEDFWQNPVPPVLWWAVPNAIALSQLEVTQDIGQLFGQDDEDFWTNPVPPVQATFYLQPGYPNFDEGLIFTPAVPSDDDENWWNPVAPVVASNYVALPIFFDNDDTFIVPPSITLTTPPGGYHLYGLQSLQHHLQHLCWAPFGIWMVTEILKKTKG